MRNHSCVPAAAIVAAVLLGTAPQASAQGCILLRQTSPLFGTTGSVDQEVGTWNVTFTGRTSTADHHYNGSVRQIQREIDKTYVVNRQHSMTATVTYQWSPRLSLNVHVSPSLDTVHSVASSGTILPSSVMDTSPS